MVEIIKFEDLKKDNGGGYDKRIKKAQQNNSPYQTVGKNPIIEKELEGLYKDVAKNDGVKKITTKK